MNKLCLVPNIIKISTYVSKFNSQTLSISFFFFFKLLFGCVAGILHKSVVNVCTRLSCNEGEKIEIGTKRVDAKIKKAEKKKKKKSEGQ